MKAKDVLHLYLGQHCWKDGDRHLLVYIERSQKFDEGDKLVIGDDLFVGLKAVNAKMVTMNVEPENIKLILRPLSSMTEEEMKEFGILEMNYEICKTPRGWYGFKAIPEEFHWLLSKGFDIFNLRENNECLYESDLKD